MTGAVFISFASIDAPIARRVVASLEASGLRCWLAERDIAPASSYPVAITDAVKNSGAVLLVLTGASSQSPHVIREIELAFNARRPVLPLRIGGATPSPDLQYFLSRSQWLDAGAEVDEAELARVKARITELLQRRPIAGWDTGRWWPQPALIGAAVLVIGIIGLVVWNGRSARNQRVTPMVEARPVRATGAPPRDAGSPARETGTPVRDDRPARGGTPARASDKPAAVAETIKVNPTDGQSYVWIPPGRFIMGCSAGDPACEKDEGPSHQVEIRRGFWLARTEVSEQQFRDRAAGRRASNSATGLPATGVSWTAAKSYCQAVGGRLPTEAEWEYAARAGTSTRYYDSLPAIAWFSGNTEDAPRAVGGRRPNAFGLYDMLGNVSEWVLDRYYNAYDDTGDPDNLEQPLAGNAFGVARGGSWVSDPSGVRVSRRLEMFPDAEEPYIGFRCASDRL